MRTEFEIGEIGTVLIVLIPIVSIAILFYIWWTSSDYKLEAPKGNSE